MSQTPEISKQVPESMEKLSHTISVLCDHINSLEERLVSVLRNEPPSAPTEQITSEVVPLAGDIQSLEKRVSCVVDRILAILNCLEIADKEAVVKA